MKKMLFLSLVLLFCAGLLSNVAVSQAGFPELNILLLTQSSDIDDDSATESDSAEMEEDPSSYTPPDDDMPDEGDYEDVELDDEQDLSDYSD